MSVLNMWAPKFITGGGADPEDTYNLCLVLEIML